MWMMRDVKSSEKLKELCNLFPKITSTPNGGGISYNIPIDCILARGDFFVRYLQYSLKILARDLAVRIYFVNNMVEIMPNDVILQLNLDNVIADIFHGLQILDKEGTDWTLSFTKSGENIVTRINEN